MMDIKCYKSTLIALQFSFFNLEADLPTAEFLGCRFAKGQFGKGPNCPVPVPNTLFTIYNTVFVFQKNAWFNLMPGLMPFENN